MNAPASRTFAAPVRPGDVLAGKYRVERILGQGGMGVVVAAMHLQLSQRVALKFLLPEVLNNPELVARFGREAQATGKIKSEHVARVLDVGTLENGAPYMVMEYLEGSDLAQIIKQRGSLPGQEAIEYILQACEALAEAHLHGIVHRDLKPANLFLTQRADGSPCVKVLDFGISKAALSNDAPQQALTQTSAVMGSPQYMSPEQLKSSRHADPRTDIWALGIILHELLAGETPFRADTVPELYVAILSLPPVPVRQRRPDAPAGVDAVIQRCLAKDPAQRFPNVAAFASALGEFAPARAQSSVERVNKIITGAASRVMPAPGSMPPPSMPVGQSASYVSGQQHAAQSYVQSRVPQSYPQQHPMQPPMDSVHSNPYAYQQPYAQTAYGPPPRQGMSTAQIALIVIIAVIVLGGGGCVTCMCIGAGIQHSQNDAPFQRPPAWTTVPAWRATLAGL